MWQARQPVSQPVCLPACARPAEDVRTSATDLISVEGVGGLLCVEQVHLLIIFKHLYLHILLALALTVLVDLCDALGQACGGQPVGNKHPRSYLPVLRLINSDHITFIKEKFEPISESSDRDKLNWNGN